DRSVQRTAAGRFAAGHYLWHQALRHPGARRPVDRPVDRRSTGRAVVRDPAAARAAAIAGRAAVRQRSEEHTSELQSRFDLVCRLLFEKKKIKESVHLKL